MMPELSKIIFALGLSAGIATLIAAIMLTTNSADPAMGPRQLVKSQQAAECMKLETQWKQAKCLEEVNRM